MRRTGSRSRASLLTVALGLGLFAAAMWFVWLGWDDTYYEVDGVEHGPYRAWQVVGCGLCTCVAAVLCLARVRRGVVLLAGAASVGFAVPWSVSAASTDDSGLWVVGLVMLLCGSSIGLVVVLTLVERLLRRRQS